MNDITTGYGNEFLLTRWFPLPLCSSMCLKKINPQLIVYLRVEIRTSYILMFLGSIFEDLLMSYLRNDLSKRILFRPYQAVSSCCTSQGIQGPFRSGTLSFQPFLQAPSLFESVGDGDFVVKPNYQVHRRKYLSKRCQTCGDSVLPHP